VVAQFEFPAAYFGRKATAGGNSDQYGLVGKSATFPEEAMGAFLALVRCVQWKSGPEEPPYKPCFAVWPVGIRGVIVARFSDAGKDQQQRPHSIHVQGAWISRDSNRQFPGSVGQLLQNQAWPGGAPRSGDALLRLNTGIPNPELDSEIVQVLNRPDSPPSILIANHQFCHHQGFGLVQEKHPLPASYRQQTVETPRQDSSTSQTSDGQAPARSRGIPIPLALCFLTLGTGLVISLSLWIRELKQENVQLSNRNTELESTAKSQGDYQSLHDKHTSTIKELESLNKEFSDVNKSFNKLSEKFDAILKKEMNK